MASYIIAYRDNNSIIIEHPEGVHSIIRGEFRDDAFYPYPESLALNNIDEDAMFDYLRNHHECTNVKIKKDE